MNKRQNRASQLHRTDMTRADKIPICLRAGMMALHPVFFRIVYQPGKIVIFPTISGSEPGIPVEALDYT